MLKSSSDHRLYKMPIKLELNSCFLDIEVTENAKDGGTKNNKQT